MACFCGCAVCWSTRTRAKRRLDQRNNIAWQHLTCSSHLNKHTTLYTLLRLRFISTRTKEKRSVDQRNNIAWQHLACSSHFKAIEKTSLISSPTFLGIDEALLVSVQNPVSQFQFRNLHDSLDFSLPGSLLGPSWGFPGASWGLFGPPGDLLGRPGTSQGSSWRVLGLSWADLFSRSNFDRFWHRFWYRKGCPKGAILGAQMAPKLFKKRSRKRS